ncbi:MAG: tRNA (adenosine(37)-N6)-threonylcarbamoyltransferase complex dimerization subunit type 1 TsaB, partial [Planctomycetes bacterium]|nr:tRNA (adenosine(37)-N6)-threonylcarbamoyltransferase complex dimerization subunit type 1 TsaB [Planctomycetota bacterium]
MKTPGLSLALETSCPVGGVALGTEDTILASQALERGMRHGRDLVPTVRRLTREEGCDLSQLQLVMVDVGPGSFTGLRVSVATAKALHLATHCLLVGVSAV